MPAAPADAVAPPPVLPHALRLAADEDWWDTIPWIDGKRHVLHNFRLQTAGTRKGRYRPADPMDLHVETGTPVSVRAPGRGARYGVVVDPFWTPAEEIHVQFCDGGKDEFVPKEHISYRSGGRRAGRVRHDRPAAVVRARRGRKVVRINFADYVVPRDSPEPAVVDGVFAPGAIYRAAAHRRARRQGGGVAGRARWRRSGRRPCGVASATASDGHGRAARGDPKRLWCRRADAALRVRDAGDGGAAGQRTRSASPCRTRPRTTRGARRCRPATTSCGRRAALRAGSRPSSTSSPCSCARGRASAPLASIRFTRQKAVLELLTTEALQVRRDVASKLTPQIVAAEAARHRKAPAAAPARATKAAPRRPVEPAAPPPGDDGDDERLIAGEGDTGYWSAFCDPRLSASAQRFKVEFRKAGYGSFRPPSRRRARCVGSSTAASSRTSRYKSRGASYEAVGALPRAAPPACVYLVGACADQHDPRLPTRSRRLSTGVA